jgi:myo-inositol-1(or 4)-monophosphatase
MSLRPHDLERRVKQASELMLRMESLLLEGYSATPGSDPARRGGLAIQTKKSYRDLVTLYDQKVEAAILDELHRLFPGEVVIGEEAASGSKESPKELAKKAEYFWVVDPIDGTTNYARAYPFFCSTLSLLKWQPDGRSAQPLLGVTFNPVNKELFWTYQGGGAWLNRSRLKVSQVTELQEALFITGFASLRSTDDMKSFERFANLTTQSLGVRRDGSAALDLAYVACGRVDAYWEWGLAPWDIATGSLLVQEAGGFVTKHSGQVFDIFDGEILASNKEIQKTLIEKLI